MCDWPNENSICRWGDFVIPWVILSQRYLWQHNLPSFLDSKNTFSALGFVWPKKAPHRLSYWTVFHRRVLKNSIRRDIWCRNSLRNSCTPPASPMVFHINIVRATLPDSACPPTRVWPSSALRSTIDPRMRPVNLIVDYCQLITAMALRSHAGPSTAISCHRRGTSQVYSTKLPRRRPTKSSRARNTRPKAN